MDEEQIIRDRLSVEERNLRRVTRKHVALMNTLEQGNIKDARQQFNDFMVDFSSYELTLTRFQAIHDMNLQETQHWNEEARRIEQEIEQTMLVIKNLEKDLAQEEEIRRNKTEYDQLAVEINEQKTREESLNAIAKLDEEILSLEEKDRLLDETLDRRRSQLQRILTVVQEVQSEIVVEREQTPQAIGDEEEAVTTPDSMRSAIVSPINNPSSPAEQVNSNNSPPQVNGINGVNSSSSNIADDEESDIHRNSRNRDDDENKQINETSPQQQSQEVSSSDNLTEVGEEIDEAELNQNVEIEDLDDGDVVTSDNEKNTVKFEEENDDIPLHSDDGDDGEIVEDSDETPREKAPRLSDDDEGLIEESEEDEGEIIKDEQ
ncbi:15728_t:CDS:2 [Funneliformis geosporum]|uniref:15728_t:CDS:1 n=1 Tax=Funneliformis geosporum TaxID=1117311 RepID=A0A9W4WWE3_9GLOM|nr:15728_t:CDS:2 [Funneliformis geosporum]